MDLPPSPPSMSTLPRGKNVQILLSCTYSDETVFFFRHDIWHFLGGAGVFFVFMFIITIDEDIKYKDRKLITVF